MALLREGRIQFASPELSRLTGYTLSELTGPSFYVDYCFVPGRAPALADIAVEPRTSAVTLQPLRGEPIECLATLRRCADGSPLAVMVIEPRGQERELDAGDVDRGLVRALARGMRSHLAGEILALRRLQESVEALEIAHDEHVMHHLSDLAHAHEALGRLDEARVDLGRRLAPLSHLTASRGTPGDRSG